MKKRKIEEQELEKISGGRTFRRTEDAPAMPRTFHSDDDDAASVDGRSPFKDPSSPGADDGGSGS